LQLTCVEQIKDGGWLCTEEQLQLRVVKPLGCGGMSEVYQAELLLQASDAAAAARPVLSTVLSEVAAPPTGMRMLAVKAPRLYEKLPPDTCAALSCDDYLFSVYAAFKKELSVTRMAGTDTPHILRCFAYTLAKSGSQPQVPALVMQLAEGGNLQQQLTPAPEQYAGIDAVPAWEVMTQVASALVALHTKARVVYEDLKPGNILAVEEHGKLRYILADFGGCRRLGVGNTAAAGCVGGTAAYMTPEVAAEQEHSITADTFSLGK
jgi:serine/threonine protein kinase